MCPPALVSSSTTVPLLLFCRAKPGGERDTYPPKEGGGVEELEWGVGRGLIPTIAIG